MSMLGNFIARLMNVIRAKGDLIVGDSHGKPSRLPVGTNDHVLTADSSTPQGIGYKPVSGSGGILPITTRGDLVVGNSTGTPIRKPRGTHGQVFTTDEGSPDGLGYKDPNSLNLQGDPSGVWFLAGGVDLDNNFLARLNPGDAGDPTTISLAIPGSMSGRLLLAVSDIGSPGRTFWMPGLHRVILGLAVSTPGTTLRLVPQIGSVDENAENFEAVATFDTIYPTTAGDSSYVRTVRVPGDQVIDGLASRRMALVLDFENLSADNNQLTVFGGMGYNHPTRIETFTSPAPAAEPPTLDGFDRDGIYYLGLLDPTEGGFPGRLTPGDGVSASYGIAISQAEGVQTHRIGITAPLTPRLVRWPGGKVAFRAFVSADLPPGNTAKITPLLMRYSEDLAVETFICALDACTLADGHSDLVLYGRHGDIETDEGQRLGLILQITVTGPDGLDLTISTGGGYPSNLYTTISPAPFLPVQQAELPVAITDRTWGRLVGPTANGQVLTANLAQPGHMEWANPSGGSSYTNLIDIDFTAAPSADLSTDGDTTIGGSLFSHKMVLGGDRGWIDAINGTGIVLESKVASLAIGTPSGQMLWTALNLDAPGYPGASDPRLDPIKNPNHDYLIKLHWEWLNYPVGTNVPGFSILLLQRPNLDIVAPDSSFGGVCACGNILNFGYRLASGDTEGNGKLISFDSSLGTGTPSGLQSGTVTSTNCAIIRVLGEKTFAWSGAYGSGNWPDLSTLTYRGTGILMMSGLSRLATHTILGFAASCSSFASKGDAKNVRVALKRLTIQSALVT